MRIEGLAMIAADTSRSRAYFQAMEQRGLLPERVVLMVDGKAGAQPGMSTGRDPETLRTRFEGLVFDLNEPLEAALRRTGTESRTVATMDINSDAAIAALSEARQDVFLYSGVGGVLLREPVLSLGKRFLHVHGGYLPDYKGSTTNYYSLLVEDVCGAAAIFLERDIDCGPLLSRRRFPPPPERERIDYLYDPVFRAVVLVETLERRKARGSWEGDGSSNSGGETYYIIHPVLKHLAILGGGAK